MSGSHCRSRGDGSLCPDTERHSPCSTPTHTRPPGVFVKCPGVASEERGGGLFTMAVSYAVIWTVQGAGGWRTGRMHTCPPQLPGPPAASRTPRPELQGLPVSRELGGKPVLNYTVSISSACSRGFSCAGPRGSPSALTEPIDRQSMQGLRGP